jgi:hypothetical protein
MAKQCKISPSLMHPKLLQRSVNFHVLGFFQRLSFLPRQQECFAQVNYVIVVKWISLVRVLTLN